MRIALSAAITLATETAPASAQSLGEIHFLIHGLAAQSFLYAKAEQHFIDGTALSDDSSLNKNGLKPDPRLTVLKTGVSSKQQARQTILN